MTRRLLVALVLAGSVGAAVAGCQSSGGAGLPSESLPTIASPGPSEMVPGSGVPGNSSESPSLMESASPSAS